jgi:hypothetical protein
MHFQRCAARPNFASVLVLDSVSYMRFCAQFFYNHAQQSSPYQQRKYVIDATVDDGTAARLVPFS